MRYAIPKCPKCGEDVHAEVDLIPGNARVSRVHDSDVFDYDGGTDVCWDGQFNVESNPDVVRLMCENGDEWVSGFLHEPDQGDSIYSDAGNGSCLRCGQANANPAEACWTRRNTIRYCQPHDAWEFFEKGEWRRLPGMRLGERGDTTEPKAVAEAVLVFGTTHVHVSKYDHGSDHLHASVLDCLQDCFTILRDLEAQEHVPDLMRRTEVVLAAAQRGTTLPQSEPRLSDTQMLKPVEG